MYQILKKNIEDKYFVRKKMTIKKLRLS